MQKFATASHRAPLQSLAELAVSLPRLVYRLVSGRRCFRRGCLLLHIEDIIANDFRHISRHAPMASVMISSGGDMLPACFWLLSPRPVIEPPSHCRHWLRFWSYRRPIHARSPFIVIMVAIRLRRHGHDDADAIDYFGMRRRRKSAARRARRLPRRRAPLPLRRPSLAHACRVRDGGHAVFCARTTMMHRGAFSCSAWFGYWAYSAFISRSHHSPL